MTDHKPLPVSGYTAQNDDKIALVNEGKALEERVLRYIERVEYRLNGHIETTAGDSVSITDGDPRFLAIGKTDIQKGWMMVYRSIFNPGRAILPEDAVVEDVRDVMREHGIEIVDAPRPD